MASILCFNPPCGFFAFRTDHLCADARIWYGVSIRRADFFAFRTPCARQRAKCLSQFQSAVRIFCFSNDQECPDLRCQPSAVSIRRADFLLFEHVYAMAVDSVGTVVSIRRADFLLFERQRYCVAVRQFHRVSIRRADFLLFERRERPPRARSSNRFQSAVRIFCFSNPGRSTLLCRRWKVSIRRADFLLFELQDIPAGATGIVTVSIRRADFLLFERPAASANARAPRSFNPPCGFFAFRTWRFAPDRS